MRENARATPEGAPFDVWGFMDQIRSRIQEGAIEVRRVLQQKAEAMAAKAAMARQERLADTLGLSPAEYMGNSKANTTFIGPAEARDPHADLREEIRDHNQTLLENARLSGLVKTLQRQLEAQHKETLKEVRIIARALRGVSAARPGDGCWADWAARGIASLRRDLASLEKHSDAAFQAISAALPETVFELGKPWYESVARAIGGLRERAERPMLNVHLRMPDSPEARAAVERALGELFNEEEIADTAQDNNPLEDGEDPDPGDCRAVGDGDGGQQERNGR